MMLVDKNIETEALDNKQCVISTYWRFLNIFDAADHEISSLRRKIWYT